MRFRIFDLVMLTLYVAVIFGAFSNDITLFRQLLFLTLVGAGALIGHQLLPRWKRNILKSSIGGSLGTLVYVGLAFVFMRQFYSSQDPFLIPPRVAGSTWLSAWLLELSLGPMLGWMVGAALGPLLAHSFRSSPLPESYSKPRMVSWSICAVLIGLLVLTANDRVNASHATRNWMALLPVVLLIFCVHTIQWVRRMNAETK